MRNYLSRCEKFSVMFGEEERETMSKCTDILFDLMESVEKAEVVGIPFADELEDVHASGQDYRERVKTAFHLLMTLSAYGMLEGYGPGKVER